MTIVEELKKKIKESGGSTSGVNDIKDAVKALNGVGGGSTSGAVIGTIEDEETDVITIDKSYNELKAMLENEICPFLIISHSTHSKGDLINVMAFKGLEFDDTTVTPYMAMFSIEARSYSFGAKSPDQKMSTAELASGGPVM